MDSRYTKALFSAGALAVGAATGRLLLDSMNDVDAPVLAALNAAADRSVAEEAPPNVEPPRAEPPRAEPPRAEPPRAALPNAPRYRLIVVLFDGLGAEAFSRSVGETSLREVDFSAPVDVGSPSLSRPVYHVLLTGVPQEVSGIRNNAHAGRARVDDVSARVREAGGTVGWALETVPWFHDLFGRPEDVYERAGEEPPLHAITDRFDAVTGGGGELSAAMKRVLDAGPSLAVLHVTRIDHAGHHHGAASEAYLRAAAESVASVAALRDAYNLTAEGPRTVWMLGADHGQLPRGGHGGPEREARITRWIGLWPAHSAVRRVEIAEEVPASRLAATFAAILGVAPPREALGEPLELPDREARPSAELAARRAAVESALAKSDSKAHRALVLRSAVWIAVLAGLAAAAVRKRARAPATETRSASTREALRALAGAALPALCASAMFFVLGPGTTLSAIVTHAAFMARSIGAMAIGAALAYPIARRLHAPQTWISVIAALLPATAYAIAAGSMGRSALSPSLWLLLPATGLVPWAVVAGVVVAQSAQTLARRLRNSSAASRA